MVDASTISDRLQAVKDQDRIIEVALSLFGSYGVKAISMDDVAANCGISRKTLSRFFENKYELLQILIATINIRVSQDLYALRETDNAMEEVFQSLPLTLNIFQEIKYRMLDELEKYHFEIWRKVDAFRQQVILDFIRANLQRGLEEGLFRNDIDLDVIAGMRLQQLIHLHSISATEQSDIRYVLQQQTNHYLSGIATPKGHEEIEKLSFIHQVDQTIFK